MAPPDWNYLTKTLQKQLDKSESCCVNTGSPIPDFWPQSRAIGMRGSER